MRGQLVLLGLIVAAAGAVRIWPAWDAVFGSQPVNFLETDAWYHVRLIEHQVRNYPWRLTLDPYAASGGQFVPVAPLFDTIAATAVVLLHGRGAEPHEVERIAAILPPVLGALTVLAVWVLTQFAFGPRAALLAAALLTVLPGHFLDRTMLGFVDHHALEALLATTTLGALAWGLTTNARAAPYLTGVSLGLYLLAWGSGALLVAVLAAWLLLLALLTGFGPVAGRAAVLAGVGAAVALVLVIVFQDPRMHRYDTQLAALAGLAAISIVVYLAASGARQPARSGAIAVTVLAAVAAGGTWLFASDLVSRLLIDLTRLTPDPARMSVLEARPLFLYSGEWRWSQPWEFFRTGFYVGLIALVPLAIRVWRHRRGIDALVLVFATAMFAAAIGQNRFGYYLMPACAVLGGWLAGAIVGATSRPDEFANARADGGATSPAAPLASPDGAMASGGRGTDGRARWHAHRTVSGLPFSRDLGVVVVAGAIFAPNLSPGILFAKRSATLTGYWGDVMTWLRSATPPPFLEAARSGDGYYYARYLPGDVPSPDYTVMNWWDQGYWVTQRARRVPVSNPTQERAPNAARFYAETDPSRAKDILSREVARYVLSDWELPFRMLADGTIMGRFQNVLEWAGVPHDPYYEILYRREGNGWTPMWIFREAYYQSMAFRLSVLGGRAAEPSNATTVIATAARVDHNGVRFREVLSSETYSTYEEARQAAAAAASADTFIVGLDPWRPAFPVDAVPWATEVFTARTPEQTSGEAPMVRVFEVR